MMTLKVILQDKIVPVIKQSHIYIYTSKSISYEMDSFLCTSSLTGLIKKYESHIDNSSLEMFQTACFPPPHYSTTTVYINL